MFELAITSDHGPIDLKHIAERQHLSEKYLSKLVIPLKSAGFISAARGAHGGYTLLKEPSEITIKDIVEAAEGRISLIDCLQANPTCDMESSCPTKGLWSKLETQIVSYLESVTLKNLIEDYKKNNNGESLIYHI